MSTVEVAIATLISTSSLSALPVGFKGDYTSLPVPKIIITRNATKREYSNAGQGAQFAYLQIDIVAASVNEVRGYAQQLSDLLSGYTGVSAGLTIGSCFIETESDVQEKLDAGREKPNQIITFGVWVGAYIGQSGYSGTSGYFPGGFSGFSGTSGYSGAGAAGASGASGYSGHSGYSGQNIPANTYLPLAGGVMAGAIGFTSGGSISDNGSGNINLTHADLFNLHNVSGSLSNYIINIGAQSQSNLTQINTITSTYLPLTGGELSGNLTILNGTGSFYLQGNPILGCSTIHAGYGEFANNINVTGSGYFAQIVMEGTLAMNGNGIANTTTIGYVGGGTIGSDDVGGIIITGNVSAVGYNITAAKYIGESASFGISIDGQGQVITTGVKGYLVVPYGATINSYSIIADQSGSIVIDLWKIGSGSALPTISNTITASAKPTLTTAITNMQDTTLTGWTTTITAYDIIGFNVVSATTVQKINLTLKVSKT